LISAQAFNPSGDSMLGAGDMIVFRFSEPVNKATGAIVSSSALKNIIARNMELPPCFGNWTNSTTLVISFTGKKLHLVHTFLLAFSY
jgi:hypothetical protein